MTVDTSIKVIPLGGVSEIGKNMTLIEYCDRILVIDCGLKFPDADMLGVDIVIPDISYLLENSDRVQGIILTHGHEDHIGALPYILRQLNVPIWGSRLTLGLLAAKLEEHKLLEETTLHEVEIGERFSIGQFDVETIQVSHSIPDGFGLAIRTPLGIIVHTGDFKFDQTPVDGKVADFGTFAALGREGVLLLLSDSTNVEKPGYVATEQIVGSMFEQVFRESQGKIIVATFASNINRIQQVFDVAALYGRKVAIAGRSMAQNVEIAERLGYLSIPEDSLIKLEQIRDLYPVEVVVMTTGSQGEPLSALTRIAVDDHKKVKVDPGDTVIISATPIPGNEDLVARTINRLFKRGAKVIYDAIAPVHVSGHANREELKLMINLTHPKYLAPVHGEYLHIARYKDLSREMGISPECVFGLEVGDVLQIDSMSARIKGKVPCGDVLVDGIGVGDVGDIVLRDRRHLACDGVVIIVLSIDGETGEMLSDADVISRGFIYAESSEELIADAKQVVTNAVANISADGDVDWSKSKDDVRSAVSKFLHSKTGRRPMVIPVVVEV